MSVQVNVEQKEKGDEELGERQWGAGGTTRMDRRMDGQTEGWIDTGEEGLALRRGPRLTTVHPACCDRAQAHIQQVDGATLSAFQLLFGGQLQQPISPPAPRSRMEPDHSPWGRAKLQAGAGARAGHPTASPWSVKQCHVYKQACCMLCLRCICLLICPAPPWNRRPPCP